MTQAKRAGLLHDLGKGRGPRAGGTHVSLGVEFARKYKEREDIIHAIEAHHNDVEPRTVVACLVQAADAISAAAPVPGGRIWRTTSSVWSSWRPSPAPIPAWIRPTPSRPAARCGSW